ncbi:HicB family protein [Singulisphaera sp. GP187]|nr:HicB family protein [Singulisphaera sp. GP187]
MPETVVHFQIRMPPALHEQLASRAREDKNSLNALVVGFLRDAVDQHEASSANSKKDSPGATPPS